VAGLVSGCYRSSTRTVAEILRDLFGVSISLGSVVACEQAVSRAVAPAVEEARSYVQRQAVANVDETNPFTMFLLPGHVQRQNLGCSA
jgi:hydroxymethylpyrimidine/phosphomethylpyrimidine kinase